MICQIIPRFLTGRISKKSAAQTTINGLGLVDIESFLLLTRKTDA